MNSQRPNILLIVAQDSGRHFGAYGCPTVSTPNIDRLASEGAICTNMLAVSSVSSPAMGSMLTGRYPQSNGLMGLCKEPWNWEMNNGEQHLAQILKLEGYSPFLFRLQHETAIENWKRLGFDDFRAKEPPTRSDTIDPQKAMTAVKVAKELTTLFGEKAKRSSIAQKPFYAQAGLFESSRPYDYGAAHRDSEKGAAIPQRLVANDEAKSQISQLQGSIKEIDKAVEIILAGLKRCGLEDDTIVIFTSTNGVEIARDKGSLYDPGIEIPFIVRWPGRIPKGLRCECLLSGVDVLPTIIDLVKADTPFNLEGGSFAKNLLGESSVEIRPEAFGLFTDSRYVRTSSMKLIANLTQSIQDAPPVNLATPAEKVQLTVFELYKLGADPGETDNRAADPACAADLKALKSKLVSWMKDVGDPFLKKVYPTEYSKKALALLNS